MIAESSCVAWIWGVVLIMFLQIGVLAAQDHFGPSFFVPKSVRHVFLPSLCLIPMHYPVGW